jgi:hypothetical protein
VTLVRTYVDGLDLNLAAIAGEANVEDLAVSIRTNVDPRRSTPWTLGKREPSTHRGKATLEYLVHEVSSLAAVIADGRAVGRTRFSVHLQARRSTQSVFLCI